MREITKQRIEGAIFITLTLAAVKIDNDATIALLFIPIGLRYIFGGLLE